MNFPIKLNKFIWPILLVNDIVCLWFSSFLSFTVLGRFIFCRSVTHSLFVLQCRLAAALKDLKNIWMMNVVSIDAPDTLPIIFERGLFGIYHDWCESFSTYPRSYDLLHADHIFSRIKKKYVFIAFSLRLSYCFCFWIR